MSGDLVHSTAPLYGWRAWRIVYEGSEPLLMGVVELYRSTTLIARCDLPPSRVGSHSPPGDDCSCGIYAVRAPWELRKYGFLDRSLETPVAFGLVSLWGDVVEHELVYRAERATAHRLWLIRGGDYGGFAQPGHDDLIDALRRRYRIPVATLPADQFGPTTYATLAAELSKAAFDQQLLGGTP